MSQRFNFEKFREHKSKGQALYRRRRFGDARYHLLKAAEYLYKLANETDEEGLRDTRIENARKMVALAKRLKDVPDNEPLPPQAEGASSSEDSKSKSTSAPADSAEGIEAVEKPNIYFKDIAGLEDVKEGIRIKMIYPFTHPEEAEKYKIRKGGGVLLYGPPGTGKTMMAKAIAAELDAPFFAITPSDILSKWVGDSEKNVSELFEKARGFERAVIFIDEVEALVPARRDGEQNVMSRLVPQILNELDGIHRKDSDGALLFVGATNEPWSIDYAMLRPGRLDEKFYIDLPEYEARRILLDIHLEGIELDDDVDLDALAAMLDGYSGADIAYLCRKVSETVFREAVTSDTSRNPNWADFQQALKVVRPSVHPADSTKFDEYHTTV